MMFVLFAMLDLIPLDLFFGVHASSFWHHIPAFNAFCNE